jgi:hypothetical protein
MDNRFTPLPCWNNTKTSLDRRSMCLDFGTGNWRLQNPGLSTASFSHFAYGKTAVSPVVNAHPCILNQDVKDGLGGGCGSTSFRGN